MRLTLKLILASSAPLALIIAGAAQAQTQPQTTPPAPPHTSVLSEVVVTAKRLDQARASIQPQTGASTYTLTSQAIQAMPGGDNAELNQVILQAPGVAQDSYGQLHIRGEHNGLQFRLDGVILPEGLSVFSQALSPRLAQSVELITGALPAEYGLRTAGIIDVSTKSGDYRDGGSVSLYGGSHGEIEPSFEVSQHAGDTNLFVSGSYLHNDLGIESPDGRSDPLHDHTDQFNGFAYLDKIIDPSSRVSVILGTSDQSFQIPDISGGQNGGLGYNVNGQTNYPSQNLNETQDETTQYGVVSYLRSTEKFTGQVSLFARYSTLKFTPDEVGDLLYNGISQSADKTDTAGGVQAEGSYQLGDAHTVRGGVIIEVDRSTSQTDTNVFLINNDPTSPAFGQQIGGAPFLIPESDSKVAETYSVYLQDEWKLTPNLILNYGLRFDEFDGYRNENQLSPRVNLVWKATPTTTIHAGYSRYFSPPPFELIGGETVAKYVAPTGNPLVTSSAAPSVTADTTPYAERANYFDVGAEQKFGSHVTATIDSYYKASTHLIDEGQFGAPIILTPFNYQSGTQWGVELTLNYTNGPFSAYANASHSVAQGKDWISSQFNFDQPSLDYVATHSIFLDHDEAYAVSAGASYLWRGTRFGGDLLFGSGLRADLPLTPGSPLTIAYPGLTAIPNGEELPSYIQVNLSLSHRFEHVLGGPIELRFDIINAFDEVYQIRDGTGVGVFAPQYGPRRGFFGGITKEF